MLCLDVLRIGFKKASSEFGIAADRGELNRTATAPANMETGYKLTIFTNSDDDLFMPIVERVGVPFE